MPNVTLINSDDYEQTQTGGCFGFAGRGGSTVFNIHRLQANGAEMVTFRYNFGRDLSSAPTEALKALWTWMAEESAWAKYVKRLNITDSDHRNWNVEIKTDIPGHCVISTASAFRMPFMRGSFITPLWHKAVLAGADPAIALLVMYALGNKVTQLNKMGASSIVKAVSSPSGQSGMGDEEVFDLGSVNPHLLYSFIDGKFEYQRNDDGRETLYKDNGLYNENILSSFRGAGERINFPHWLTVRFNTFLTSPDFYRVEGSMGSSASRKLTSPIYTSSLIGWALQLSTEFRSYRRFLGLRGGL